MGRERSVDDGRGVWEVRVSAGTDSVTGRTIQRSFTFHGDEAEAEAYRIKLVAHYVARRSVARAAHLLSIGELLDRWLEADDSWKPST